MQPDFGFLYALTNAAMPGHIKIGMTRRRPEERMAELSSATGVPVEFELAYSRAFENAPLAERMVHERLSAQGVRVSQNREFFQVSVTAAIAVIDEVAENLSEGADLDADLNRFVYQADQILADGNATTAQLERALSYLEYAGELGSPVERYRAGVLAHDMANRRNSDSSRGIAYRERAHQLFEQAAAEGVVRAYSQRALMFLETDDMAHAHLAMKSYLESMPVEQFPDGELDYLVTTLHDSWFPNHRAPNLMLQLNPWRAQICKKATKLYDKGDPFHAWLKINTHTATDILKEKAKLPLAGLIALTMMYLANPAAFFTMTVLGFMALGLVWRWKSKRKATDKGKKGKKGK